MIEKLLLKVRGRTRPASLESESVTAARTACATQVGATGLAESLAAQHEATRAIQHPLRGLLSRQREVALHAAEYHRLHDDLTTRIPAVLERNAKASASALSEATRRLEQAKRVHGAAAIAHSARLEALERLRDARIKALAAPADALQSAKQRLGTAMDSGDAAAIDGARTQFGEALNVLEDAERGQRARELELQIMEESENRARAAIESAEADVGECAAAVALANAKTGAVEADRATLAAALVHVRLASMKFGPEVRPFASAFGRASFYFHEREHAPLCDDESGWILLDGWRLKRVIDALVEPDFQCFDTVAESVSLPEIVAPQTGPIEEPFDPRVAYPHGHPHFAPATDPSRA